MTAFYVGEGLSGLIPGLAGIAQGVGEQTCTNVTSTKFDNSTGLNVTDVQVRIRRGRVAIANSIV